MKTLSLKTLFSGFILLFGLNCTAQWITQDYGVKAISDVVISKVNGRLWIENIDDNGGRYGGVVFHEDAAKSSWNVHMGIRYDALDNKLDIIGRYYEFEGNNNVENKKPLMTIFRDRGRVAIGTEDPGSHKLAVEGSIGAREVNVTAQNPWPDFVFENEYKLKRLEDVSSYIDQNQRLPDMPSAEEVSKEGINLGDMNTKLLQKIEELTLYLIDQNNRLKELESKNEELLKRLENIE